MNNLFPVALEEIAKHPAWPVLVGLGGGINIEQIQRTLKVNAIRQENLSPTLDAAEDLGLFEVLGGRVKGTIVWKARSLHEATLSLLKNPLMIKAANLDRSPWSHDSQSICNSLRLFVYLNRHLDFANLQQYSQYHELNWANYFVALEIDWLEKRHPTLQEAIFTYLMPVLWCQGTLPEGLADYLSQSPLWPGPAVELALFQGQLDRADELLKRNKPLQSRGYTDMLALLRGQPDEAHNGFQKRIQRRKPGVGVFNSVPALFARLAALRSGELEGAKDARYAAPLYNQLDRLLVYVAHVLGEPPSRNGLLNFPFYESPRPGLELCLTMAVETALPPEWVPDRSAQVVKARERLESSGLQLMASQLLEVEPSQRPATHWGQGLYRQETWEFFLSTLRTRGLDTTVPSAAAKKEVDERLVWLLHPPDSVEVMKQKWGKQGWRSGAKIAWKTLLDSPPDFLLEQDRVVLGKVQRLNRFGYTELAFGAGALKALVGHPHLISKGEPCQLVEIPLRVHLSEKGKNLQLGLQPEMPPGMDCVIIDLGPGQLGLCAPDAQQLKLVHVLRDPQNVPSKARERLVQSLEPWLDRVEVSYDVGVEPLLPTRQGDSRLVVQLRPYKQGLRVGLRVRPLGDEGPLFLPGRGPAQESLRWNNQTLLVKRDLSAEIVARGAILTACEALYDSDDQEFPEAEEALELLLQLQKCKIPLEWPENKPWTVRAPVNAKQLRLQAESGGGWFELQGQLNIDGGLKVELAHLLEMSRTSQGRFIALEEGQFIALTEDLKQKLTALDELVEHNRKQLRLSPLAVPSLAELDESIQGDEAFIETLERFRSAESYMPQLPRGLQAELRDYQLDGFRWLARRARSGAGVCLADDMGLGKTVQTIALLLMESAAGPHLVLCPTSVTSNWFDQIQRFAPQLRPIFLEGKQRTKQLAELKPGDVVIASYRILLQDRLELNAIPWNVVVLDEAQFIKNPESKTARAAFELPGRVRLATTGTPIENRLSELWSIFRFLNPGLLGTLPSFRRRFEGPVLAGQSGPRQRLRRLVGPFILRRTKSQVLSELPPRTEISLTVELSAPERALYEEVRQRAEKGLSGAAGQFELLAQLTRLRQACCHPQLLLPEQQLASSKFEAFFGLAEDLLAGRHRTLVFSQFVELLKLLEKELQARGLNYLYLDGSTPVSQRRERVDSFQSGEADFFLISLKAGGTGLNLTGADYVVHLDPWWNPAAEDQASDRAHRIGQTRPVTIYRLIAKDTIEEKVVQLHGIKRELAQGILDGADGKSQMSSQELWDLLKG